MTVIIAVFGKKKSGKTAVIEALIRALNNDNLTITAAKHVHHADFSIDNPSKDSWRFGKAGARRVFIFSPNELVSIEKTSGNEVDEERLLNIISDSATDIVFLEGFYQTLARNSRVYKLVVGRDSGDVADIVRGCHEPLLGCALLGNDDKSNEVLKAGKTYKLWDDFNELVRDIRALARR
ncbi:MAG: molybdopterin-guanine dinucleotide biosynthesis protein B [Aigarchaeota archaeon]|nr:molybdopterin-guanine dinucleotide biosynthesis protein B [Candidatus Pelearchaeum maunauluense]